MRFSWWYDRGFIVVCLLLGISSFCSFVTPSVTGNEPQTNATEKYKVVPLNVVDVNSSEESKNDTVANNPPNNTTDDADQKSRSFPSSGSENLWLSAGRMVTRGLRLFRESLLEGAKVAHMFKEDLDEGMSTIMRKNRGVKVDPSQQNNDSSGSFFDSQSLREGVLGGILRFMGINSKQVGVIALNCLIILAEWITSSMIGKNEIAGATSRMVKTNLLEWASTGHNNQIEKLLTQMRSHSLPEKMIDSLTEKTGNTTSCVQLLICKMTPVIWGFQDTVKAQFNYSDHELNIKTARKPGNGTAENGETRGSEPKGFLATSQFVFDKFLGSLPDKERIMHFGDRCEAKFPHCQLLKFNSLKK